MGTNQIIWIIADLLFCIGVIIAIFLIVVRKIRNNYKNEGKYTPKCKKAENEPLRKLTTDEVYPVLLKDFKKRGEMIKNLITEINTLKESVIAKERLIENLSKLPVGEQRALKNTLYLNEQFLTLKREKRYHKIRASKLAAQNAELLNKILTETEAKF